ncbi:hypothetical protein GWK47_013934 [Chionoecetes opilio]|uniref:Uncharacterized protein n=1 Tax=Chionoecetes opilio TaxID=41210 RepID=A0A8J4XTX3_CHIOP|nr:hypothetical protein GWK47_013934 [Chionoecetes opilio]
MSCKRRPGIFWIDEVVREEALNRVEPQPGGGGRLPVEGSSCQRKGPLPGVTFSLLGGSATWMMFSPRKNGILGTMVQMTGRRVGKVHRREILTPFPSSLPRPSFSRQLLIRIVSFSPALVYSAPCHFFPPFADPWKALVLCFYGRQSIPFAIVEEATSSFFKWTSFFVRSLPLPFKFLVFFFSSGSNLTLMERISIFGIWLLPTLPRVSDNSPWLLFWVSEE